MAALHDKTTTATGTGSFSFTHTPVGTPTFVAVDVGLRGSGNPEVQVTYGGVSMSAQSTFSKGSLRFVPLVLENPASGAKTVQVTIIGGTIENVIAACRTYTGTPTSGTWETTGGRTGTDTGPNANPIPAALNTKLAHNAALIDKGQSTSINPEASATERYDVLAGISGDRPRMSGSEEALPGVGYNAGFSATASVDWIAWTMSLNSVPVYKDGAVAVAMAMTVAPNGALIASPKNGSVVSNMAMSVSPTGGNLVKKDGSVAINMALAVSVTAEIGHRAFIAATKRFAITQLTLRNSDRNVEIVARQV